MKISVLIPVVRTDNLDRLKSLIYENAGLPSSKFEILHVEDTNREGCPKTLAKLVHQSKNDLMAFLGDDTEPGPGFLLEAWREMVKFPGNWGLVGFQDAIAQRG